MTKREQVLRDFAVMVAAVDGRSDWTVESRAALAAADAIPDKPCMECFNLTNAVCRECGTRREVIAPMSPERRAELIGLAASPLGAYVGGGPLHAGAVAARAVDALIRAGVVR